MAKASIPPGPGDRFPGTRVSVVAALGSDDAARRAAAFTTLALGYWMPVYAHLRARWQMSSDDARELTQGFFAHALAKGFLARFDPQLARFRTYVRLCVDSFVSTARRRPKVGGEPVVLTPLDVARAERDLAAADGGDEQFDRAFRNHLFSTAFEALRALCDTQGITIRFQVLERYELADPGAEPSYADVARELGIPETQVTNHLAWARRKLRRLVLETLRELTATDEELLEEAKALFGAKGLREARDMLAPKNEKR